MTITESINTVNSSVRTLLALTVLGGVGYAGWQGYSIYNEEKIASTKVAEQLRMAEESLVSTQSKLANAEQDIGRKSLEIEKQGQEISVLNEDILAKAKEIDRLDTAMRLLKVDHRIALLNVVDQKTEEDMTITLVEFQELTPQGEPAGEAKRFTIDGDVVYIDNWVVKFDDEYVERAEIDRATSLVLFRRIFGEYQEPRHGHTLDQVGTQPLVYSRGGKPSELERKIWSEFWMIANDEARAKELGIRAAHGEAVSIKVKKGKSYRVTLRASDGLSIQPNGDVKSQPRKSL